MAMKTDIRLPSDPSLNGKSLLFEFVQLAPVLVVEPQAPKAEGCKYEDPLTSKRDFSPRRSLAAITAGTEATVIVAIWVVFWTVTAPDALCAHAVGTSPHTLFRSLWLRPGWEILGVTRTSTGPRPGKRQDERNDEESAEGQKPRHHDN